MEQPLDDCLLNLESLKEQSWGHSCFWCTYINDIGENLSCSLRLFADDCLLYQVISSEEDCIKLQHDLDSIYKWSNTWQMRFNLDKCVTLKCYKSLSPILTNYFINDHKLENVKQHPYLGITLDQSMSFIPHINNITCKATKVLNFIKRNLHKCSQYAKSNAYTLALFDHF